MFKKSRGMSPNKQRNKPHKTKKRLAIKKAMLAERAARKGK